jgi:thiamine pyrophosphokinase
MPLMPDPQDPPRTPRHALVVADGDVPSRAALDTVWPGWADGVTEVIAADGGLARAWTLGLDVDLLVGDLDSLSPHHVREAEASGIEVLRASTDKDESDAELALLEAVRRGATRVTMLGAFGGPRLDHALANLWLLAHPSLAGAEVDVILLDAPSRVRLVAAPAPGGGPVTRSLAGPPGATVSLLPFGGPVTGITTVGLRYPLRDEPLVVGPARGLSNVRTLADAMVTVRSGRLLVVETAIDAEVDGAGAAGLSSPP